jgi:hypothetical protein
LVDWDTLQIDDKVDDEGRFEVLSEEQVYSVLGLQKEDDSEQHEREGGGSPYRVWNNCDDKSATILILQQLPGEHKMFDRNNPVMEPSSLYPNMEEFRLAMRQYAINKEFELGIEATNTTRYRDYCRGGDCPWSINARVEHKGWDPIVVSVLYDDHECTSSGRRRTSTPTSTWVAYKVLPILMSELELRAKKLQKRLQEKYNVTIGYDTVWHGKEKAMAEMYGTWEENF